KAGRGGSGANGSPDDDPTAEAHPPDDDAANACRLPQLYLPGQRKGLIEALDARPKEAAGFVPAARDHPPERRQTDPGVEAPGPYPGSGRDAELEARDAAAGLHHARQLAQG